MSENNSGIPQNPAQYPGGQYPNEPHPNAPHPDGQQAQYHEQYPFDPQQPTTVIREEDHLAGPNQQPQYGPPFGNPIPGPVPVGQPAQWAPPQAVPVSRLPIEPSSYQQLWRSPWFKWWQTPIALLLFF
ncbi:MAG: hypothetical protein CSA83_02235, partial [Actinomycetales bacterium]